MQPDYPSVAQRAAHRCEYCHAPEQVFNSVFQVEHINPEARGGPKRDLANLALSCSSCNLYKGAHVDGTDDETGDTVSLFHPRTDRWRDHFSADEVTGKVHGLTPVGRATIARLRMNSTRQVEARIQWVRLGLFP